ncbi:amino acid permease, partial [filamentous cyanobacterium CCP5]
MGKTKEGQLGFPAVWALAAGGMVGGGIYTALGVVVAVAVQWSWLSFVIAGIVALTAAYSYAFLANKFEQGGGAFEFLREIHWEGVAGSLSWMLIIGYVLTMSVYAYAFGHYVAFALGAGPWVTRGLAIAIMAVLISLNLMGTGKTSSVEIVIVVGNLIILIGLGAIGLLQWDPV